MHNFVQFIMMGIVMLFATSLFYYLPYPVLAAIIMSALKSMLAFGEAKRLYRVSPSGDFVIWVVSFMSTLFMGVSMGIGLGMLTSMGLLLQQTSRPTWADLGRLKVKGAYIYRNVERFPDAEKIPSVLMFRFDAPLNFSNKDYFAETLEDQKQLHSKSETGVHLVYIILDFSCITALDTSAILMLEDMIKDHKKKGYVTLFATCRGPVRDAFVRTNLFEKIGKDNMLAELNDAVDFAVERVQESNDPNSELFKKLAQRDEEDMKAVGKGGLGGD